MAAPEADWKDEWSDPNYEWPVTPAPSGIVVDQLGKTIVARGGRAVSEAHADRSVVMDFPNEAMPDTRIRRQERRTECRRRAQVMLPNVADEPLKVCVVCDAVHLWPNVANELTT